VSAETRCEVGAMSAAPCCQAAGDAGAEARREAADEIAVIVPALDEEQALPGFLEDLLARRGRFRVVVAEGGSVDGTLAAAGAFPWVTTIRAPRGRGAQMNAGARAAGGAEILLFVHADSRLPPDAFAAIHRVLADPAVVAGSFCLAFDRADPWLRLYARASRVNHPLFTYGDQGLFLRREVFDRVGGFPEIPLMEDVEIQRRLRKLGRFVKIRRPIVTSARRFLRRGVLRQQALNAALVSLYYLGVPAVHLARAYGPMR
jgi:rSAM/selenodomain-associated transferase 2